MPDQKLLILIAGIAIVLFLPQILTFFQKPSKTSSDNSSLLTEMLSLKQNLAANGQCKASELVGQAAMAVLGDKEDCQQQTKKRGC